MVSAGMEMGTGFTCPKRERGIRVPCLRCGLVIEGQLPIRQPRLDCWTDQVTVRPFGDGGLLPIRPFGIGADWATTANEAVGNRTGASPPTANKTASSDAQTRDRLTVKPFGDGAFHQLCRLFRWLRWQVLVSLRARSL